MSLLRWMLDTQKISYIKCLDLANPDRICTDSCLTLHHHMIIDSHTLGPQSSASWWIWILCVVLQRDGGFSWKGVYRTIRSSWVFAGMPPPRRYDAGHRTRPIMGWIRRDRCRQWRRGICCACLRVIDSHTIRGDSSLNNVRKGFCRLIAIGVRPGRRMCGRRARDAFSSQLFATWQPRQKWTTLSDWFLHPFEQGPLSLGGVWRSCWQRRVPICLLVMFFLSCSFH